MIAEIALGASVLTSLGLNAWLTYKTVRATEHAASVQVAQAHVEGELSRLVFERDTLEAALADSKRRNLLLSEAYANEIATSSPLAADDVLGRLRRLEVSFGTDGGVLAGDGGGTVSPDPAPEAPEAGAMPEPATRLL